MKITEYGAIRSPADIKKLKRAGAAGGSSFADMLEAAADTPETSETAGAGDVSATSALNTMLALQEISEEDIQRKKIVQRGKNLLDSLDKLRQQILTGAIPHQTLLDLTRQLSLEKQSINDPRLLALIEDIELRAAVELAKLEMSAKEGL